MIGNEKYSTPLPLMTLKIKEGPRNMTVLKIGAWENGNTQQ